jgi:hypothetical protein
LWRLANSPRFGLTLADTGEQAELLRHRDQWLWTRWYWISVTQNIGGRADGTDGSWVFAVAGMLFNARSA